MVNGVITTTLPVEIIKEIKERMLHYNELIIIGLQAKKGMPNLLERVRELETGNIKLQKKLGELYAENVSVNDRLTAFVAEHGK